MDSAFQLSFISSHNIKTCSEHNQINAKSCCVKYNFQICQEKRTSSFGVGIAVIELARRGKDIYLLMGLVMISDLNHRVME